MNNAKRTSKTTGKCPVVSKETRPAKSPAPTLVEQAIAAIAANKDDPKVAAIMAMMGIEGHARHLLSSDSTLMAALTGHLEAGVKALKGPYRGIKIEVCDDAGLSRIQSPTLCSRRYLDQGDKLGTLIGMQGYTTINIRAGLDVRNPGQSDMIVTARIVGYVDENADLAGLQDRLRNSGIVSDSSVPQIAVSEFDKADVRSAIKWSLAKPRKPIRLEDDEFQNRKWVSVSGGYAPDIALRLIEASSLMAISETIDGVGKEGKSVIRRIRSRVDSAHKGRVDSGTILERDVDIWSVWAQFWMGQSNGFLPCRSDIPLGFGRVGSLAKAQKRTRAMPSAKAQKAAKDKYKTRHKRLAKPEEN